jgi:hypothetical protein
VGAVGWYGNAVVAIFERTRFEHEIEKTTRLTNARHIQRSQSHCAKPPQSNTSNTTNIGISPLIRTKAPYGQEFSSRASPAIYTITMATSTLPSVCVFPSRAYTSPRTVPFSAAEQTVHGIIASAVAVLGILAEVGHWGWAGMEWDERRSKGSMKTPPKVCQMFVKL